MTSSFPTKPLPTKEPRSEQDDIDDLFDYDVGGINDVFSENYQSASTKEITKDSSSKVNSGANLGIDEEVEVTRKARAPRVKLDEHRLLSAAGIPKLRKKAKDHLKFKGRGHEYSDASKLLSFYQLWLDDLFPKARFLDALAMVEKTGHKKMMQLARVEWINEGKPRSSVHEDSLFDEPALPVRPNGDRENTAISKAPIFANNSNKGAKTPKPGAFDKVDLYNATPEPTNPTVSDVGISQDSLFGRSESLFGNTGPTSNVGTPEDDLDALFAEQSTLQEGHGNAQLESTGQKNNPPEAEYDDEMEAMAEMEGLW